MKKEIVPISRNSVPGIETSRLGQRAKQQVNVAARTSAILQRIGRRFVLFEFALLVRSQAGSIVAGILDFGAAEIINALQLILRRARVANNAGDCSLNRVVDLHPFFSIFEEFFSVILPILL